MSEYKIATYDLETCDLTNENKNKEDTYPYALGFYKKNFYKEIYSKNRDDNILKDFLDYLYFSQEEKKLLIYAHNGGKFDTYLLLKEILNYKRFTIISCMFQSGRILNLKLVGNNKIIVFRDSYNLITSSLDAACKSFKPKTVKLEGDVDHDKINIDNCTTKEIYEYTKDYLKNDCISLFEIIESFDKVIQENFDFSCKDVMTNAGIARKVYSNRYYNKKLFKLPKATDSLLRKYYFGGRNEVMDSIGYEKGKFYYFDFTSLYPYVMGNNILPYDRYNHIIVEDKKNFDKKWFGFVKCNFRNKHKNNYPLHAVVKEGKLVFPHVDNWTESVISTEEIKYSIDNDIGYEYEFLEVYNYEKKDKIFKKCIDDVYKMKLKAQKEGKKALRSIAKIILNSMYGFWGMNYHNRPQKILVKEFDDKKKKNKNSKKASEKREARFNGYLFSQQLKNYKQVKGYDIYDIEGPIKARFVNVGIASMITSYARMELYKLMKDIKDKGGRIKYMDTDSVITDYDIYNDKEMNQKWIRSGGEKLGELTNETEEKGGYYTEICTLGCKMYALKNEKLINPNLQTILKMKGINIKAKYKNKSYDHENKKIYLKNLSKFEGKEKVNFNDYILLSKGYELVCDNMNFISGVEDMIVKDKGLIKLKNEKKLNSLYDKANVDKDFKITPLTI